MSDEAPIIRERQGLNAWIYKSPQPPFFKGGKQCQEEELGGREDSSPTRVGLHRPHGNGARVKEVKYRAKKDQSH